MDPELLGCLLEGVVHGKLPDLLLELVETLLPSFLVPSDDCEMVFGALNLLLSSLALFLLAGVITFSGSLWSCLVPAPANLADNISSGLISLQLCQSASLPTAGGTKRDWLGLINVRADPEQRQV